MTLYISNIARSPGDPKVLHPGPSSLGSADRMAKALGWFSIALGVAELVAPLNSPAFRGRPQVTFPAAVRTPRVTASRS